MDNNKLASVREALLVLNIEDPEIHLETEQVEIVDMAELIAHPSMEKLAQALLVAYFREQGCSWETAETLAILEM